MDLSQAKPASGNILDACECTITAIKNGTKKRGAKKLLAERSGISAGAISNYLNSRCPDMHSAIKLANGLDCRSNAGCRYLQDLFQVRLTRKVNEPVSFNEAFAIAVYDAGARRSSKLYGLLTAQQLYDWGNRRASLKLDTFRRIYWAIASVDERIGDEFLEGVTGRKVKTVRGSASMDCSDFSQVAPYGVQVLSSSVCTQNALKPHTVERGSKIALSELSGLCAATISHYIAGNRTPNHQALIKLSEALDLFVWEGGCDYLGSLFHTEVWETSEDARPLTMSEAFAKAWWKLSEDDREDVDYVAGRNTRDFWQRLAKQPTLNTMRYAYFALRWQDRAIADEFLSDMLGRKVTQAVAPKLATNADPRGWAA